MQYNKIVKSNYSTLDKLFHQIVLGSKLIQATSFDIQRLINPNPQKTKSPVFIVGMARSGTTTLLNLLFATGDFESIRYRDLPFPLMPYTWNSFRQKFRQAKPLVTRAHDDGIEISIDHPEAFEEIFWNNVGDEMEEKDAIECFTYYINAISSGRGESKRYLSKNNNNLVRLKTINKICETAGGKILVPIRNPLKTAESSLRVHKRFQNIQRSDPFVLKYMNHLGHKEFGFGIEPIQIGQRVFQSSHQPNQIEYWIEYWIYIHNGISNDRTNNMCFIDFDKLRNKQTQEFDMLLDTCELSKIKTEYIKGLKPDNSPSTKSVSKISKALLEEAESIKMRLTVKA